MTTVLKLGQGLRMTFEGMAMVFDSIGVDMSTPTVNSVCVKQIARYRNCFQYSRRRDLLCCLPSDAEKCDI